MELAEVACNDVRDAGRNIEELQDKLNQLVRHRAIGICKVKSHLMQIAFSSLGALYLFPDHGCMLGAREEGRCRKGHLVVLAMVYTLASLTVPLRLCLSIDP